MRQSSKINLLVASLFSLTAYAADLTTDKIEVISVTPLPSLGVTLDKIPSNVQTVKASDIDKSQALDISNYMNQSLSGVYMNEMQGNPLQADLNYRGYTASPLLGMPQGMSVFMDGVRMNQPFGDVVSWDLIPKGAIKSMQLMPGSNPLYGLNTLGGAVSIQTKDGRNSPGGSIQTSIGSYKRSVTEFTYGGVTKDNSIDYFIAGSYFDENGWRDHSNSDNKQLFGKLGWQGEKTDLKLTYAYSKSDLNGNGLTPRSMLYGANGDYNNVYTFPDNTKNDSHFLNLTFSHLLQDKTLLSGNAYYRKIKAKTINGDFNDAALSEIIGDWGQTVTGSYTGTGADANAKIANSRAQYETAYGDNLYQYAGLKGAKATCDGQIPANAAAAGEPGEKCSAMINRSSTTQKNYGLATQLSSENKIFDKANSYVVGAGIDLSKSNFEQTAEYGYFDSPYAGANIIGSGYFANETTHGNLDHKLDDRSAKLKSKSRTWSLFATDTLSLTDSFHVTGSARYNYTNIKNTDQQIHHVMVSDVMTSTIDSNASLDGDHNYHRLNPSVGFNYSPVKSFTTFAGYNEGSRTPSQSELGCANPLSPCRLPNSMAGDPYLKQVVSKTFEAGFRGASGNLNYSAAVYSARNIDDIMFVAAGSSSTYGYFKNFGETQRRGLEASLSGRFDNLSVGGNYGYTDATYQSDETVGGAANSSNEDEKIQIRKGNHIPLVPKHVLKLFANYALNDKLSFGVDTRTVSSSYLRGNENNQHQPGEHDIDAVVTDLGGTTPESNYLSGGKTAGFTVVNFSAAFKPKEDWLIFGRINNVFDRQYETGGQLGANPYNSNGALQLSEYTYDSSGAKKTVGKTHTVGEAFVAPGAPRSVWVGVRWEFGGAKKSAE